MNKSEREEFRAFCRNATDSQLAHIIADEKERARSGSEYYQVCFELAQEELERRVRTGGVRTGGVGQ